MKKESILKAESQPSIIELLQFLNEAPAKKFSQCRAWLAKAKDPHTKLQRIVGILQAVHQHWKEHNHTYKLPELNALLVNLLQWAAKLFEQLDTPDERIVLLNTLLIELQYLLSLKKFITFEIGDSKQSVEADRLPLADLFSIMPNASQETTATLSVALVVDIVQQSYSRSLISWKSVVAILGSLAACKSLGLSGQAHFNPFMNIALQVSPAPLDLSAQFLLSLGQLALAQRLDGPVRISHINELLTKSLNKFKNPDVALSLWVDMLRGIWHLSKTLMIDEAWQLDIKSIESIAVYCFKSKQLNGRIFADLLQVMQRLYVHTDQQARLDFTELLNALQSVTELNDQQYETKSVCAEKIVKYIGRTLLSLGQLVATNIEYYYNEIEGTPWIKTLHDLLNLLQTIIARLKSSDTSQNIDVYLQNSIYALRGSVLAGKSLPTAASDYLLQWVFTHESHLEDAKDLPLSDRHQRVVLVGMLDFYTTVVEASMPEKLIAFAKKLQTELRKKSSIQDELLTQLSKRGFIECVPEGGLTCYPYDLFCRRSLSEKEKKAGLASTIDYERDDKRHEEALRGQRDLIRDMVVGRYVNSVVRYPYTDKVTVNMEIDKILEAKKNLPTDKAKEFYTRVPKELRHPKVSFPETREDITPIPPATATTVTTDTGPGPAKRKGRRKNPGKRTPRPTKTAFPVGEPLNLEVKHQPASSDNSNSVAKILKTYRHLFSSIVHMNHLQWLADNNNETAQLLLGLIYFWGKDQAIRIDQTFYYFQLTQDFTQSIYWFERLTKKGYALGQYYLGLCYERGSGVPANPETAFSWYQLSAHQSLPEAAYGLGLCYYKGDGVKQDYKEAVKWFQRAASLNNSTGNYELSVCYREGHGVSQDIKESFRLLQLAAEKGSPAAQFNLALHYLKGEGVAKEPTKGIELLREIVDEKTLLEKKIKILFAEVLKDYKKVYCQAVCCLASCYENGNGVTKDRDKAFLLHLAIVEYTYAPSYYRLALYYLTHQPSLDYTNGILWLRRASDLGHKQAQFELGRFYHLGKNVDKNITEAIKQYRLAVDQGHSEAQYELAMCLDETQDYKAAMTCFEKASRNHPGAYINLAIYNMEGRDIPENPDRALVYFRLALSKSISDSGSAFINENMAVIFAKREEYSKEHEHLILAATMGSPTAQYNLGRIYAYGNKAIPIDLAKAKTWWEKAKENGSADAESGLQYLKFKEQVKTYDHSGRLIGSSSCSTASSSSSSSIGPAPT